MYYTDFYLQQSSSLFPLCERIIWRLHLRIQSCYTHSGFPVWTALGEIFAKLLLSQRRAFLSLFSPVEAQYLSYYGWCPVPGPLFLCIKGRQDAQNGLDIKNFGNPLIQLLMCLKTHSSYLLWFENAVSSLPPLRLITILRDSRIFRVWHQPLKIMAELLVPTALLFQACCDTQGWGVLLSSLLHIPYRDGGKISEIMSNTNLLFLLSFYTKYW